MFTEARQGETYFWENEKREAWVVRLADSRFDEIWLRVWRIRGSLRRIATRLRLVMPEAQIITAVL